jgi:hypothetical protein
VVFRQLLSSMPVPGDFVDSLTDHLCLGLNP